MEQGYPVPCASAGDGDDRVGAVEGEADLSNRAEVLFRNPGGVEVDSRDGRGAEPFLVVGRGRALDAANTGVLREQRLDWFGDKGDSWGICEVVGGRG